MLSGFNSQPTALSNDRGMALIFALGVTVLVALVGIIVVGKIGSASIYQQNNYDKIDKLKFEMALKDLLSNPDQCLKNLSSVLRYGAGSSPVGQRFEFANLALKDTSSRDIRPLASTRGPDANVEALVLSNFKAEPQADSYTGELSVRWLAPPIENRGSLARKDLLFPEFKAEFVRVGSYYELASCSVAEEATSTYQGELLGTPLKFKETWATAMNSKTETRKELIDLSLHQSARMVNINGVCGVRSSDAGVGVRVDLLSASGKIVSLDICYIWGTSDSRTELFQAGQFFQIPKNAEKMELIFYADAGGSGGSYWDAEAEIAFFR